MINNFPFFRGPFYRYPRYYSTNRTHLPYNNLESNTGLHSNSFNNSKNLDDNHIITDNLYISNTKAKIKESNSSNINEYDNDKFHSSNTKEKSSKHFPLGPILINTDGFFDKNEPVFNLSGLKIYLDDIIIVSLIYILYKEDVKDDVLFISLLLLLIS